MRRLAVCHMRASASPSSRGALSTLGTQLQAANSQRRTASATAQLGQPHSSASRPARPAAMRSRGQSGGSPDSRGSSGIQQHLSQVHPRHPTAVAQADDRGAASTTTTTVPPDEPSTSKGGLEVDLESRAASKGTSYKGFKVLGLDPSPELVAISMGEGF